MDLFSSEFLHHLKEQLKSRTKTSKTLVEALRDLKNKNQESKRKILQLESQIQSLRHENLILVEINQQAKLDYEEVLKLKDRKIQMGIQIEARLFSEKQELEQEIYKLTEELNMLKLSSIQDKFEGKLNEAQKSYTQKSIAGATSLNSQQNLNAYLFSQKKQKTERSEFSNKSNGEEEDQSNFINLKQNDIDSYLRHQNIFRSESYLKDNAIDMEISRNQTNFDYLS